VISEDHKHRRLAALFQRGGQLPEKFVQLIYLLDIIFKGVGFVSSVSPERFIRII
jgi:hypothetical protein